MTHYFSAHPTNATTGRHAQLNTCTETRWHFRCWWERQTDTREDRLDESSTQTRVWQAWRVESVNVDPSDVTRSVGERTSCIITVISL